MQDLLGRRLVRLQHGLALEGRWVAAIQAHDVAGREHPPQVGRGVVAQRGQLAPRRGVAQRARVEVELRVGHDALAVAHQRLLQVADAHVVGDDGQVVAPELALGEVEVARGGLDRLGRVEALVDAPAQRLALAHPAAAQDAAREALGGLDVDVQAEQVLAGLGQDLGQPRGRVQVVGGARVGAAGRFEHDDRLEHAGVEPVALGDAVDDRPPVRGALGRGHHAARALGVEHVAEAERGAALVGRALGGHVGEGLAVATPPTTPGPRALCGRSSPPRRSRATTRAAPSSVRSAIAASRRRACTVERATVPPCHIRAYP